MKIYSKRKLVSAILAAALLAACLIACFATGWEPRFLLAFFLALVFAGFAFYGALSKTASPDAWTLCTDERDIFIAMKASQAALLILNRLLLSVCTLSVFFYAVFRAPACLVVILTLCAVSIALFVIVLATNLFYERRG